MRETTPGGPRTNHLIREKSPYLLQHAGNPVDWHPWGEEAFEKARREEKPIFLSIGYSTCHWCHVMARESFENEEIAAILNEYFVSIKVDREERPDIDRVYMTYVQAATGGGGWPMSVWLTPDLKPFMGGTYYPPEDRLGRPGFNRVLRHVAAAWRTDRNSIVTSADTIIRQLQQSTTIRGDAAGGQVKSLLDTGYQQFKSSYEPLYGGFGRAPKFPHPASLGFMLRYHARTGAKDALDTSLFTLRKMADGGMHDHIGGGFHRYSVDNEWHVPHFEKMLYDQAQLAWSYLDAYQITRDEFFADVARDTLEYVLRDMTGKAGEFYGAEDADSALPGNTAEHAEGAFYVWAEQELRSALGEETAAMFNYHYGVEQEGNVAADAQGEFCKKNILIVRHTPEETGKRFNASPDEVRISLVSARLKLRLLRAQRPRPHLDDKTLTAWNGLMISAFARAAQVLDEPRYLAAAQKAAAFIESQLLDKRTGRLMRRYRGGETAIDGFAEDYAFFIQGLIDLYEASFDVRWLMRAVELQKKQDELFWDKAGGGYFSTSGNDPRIMLRTKEDYDGAEPSPNSVAALNLLRLSQMTDNKVLLDRAETILSVMGGHLRKAPSAMPQMLVAFEFHLARPRQVIVAGSPDHPDTRAMIRAVRRRFIPNMVLLLADGAEGQTELARQFQFIRDCVPLQGKATAYVCEGNTCKLPTSDVETLLSILSRPSPSLTQPCAATE